MIIFSVRFIEFFDLISLKFKQILRGLSLVKYPSNYHIIIIPYHNIIIFNLDVHWSPISVPLGLYTCSTSPCLCSHHIVLMVLKMYL